MLVDSGADVCLIDSKIVRNIPKNDIVGRSNNRIEVKGVWGQHGLTTGTRTIKTRIGGQTYNIPFVIVKDLGKTGILGSNFLQSVNSQMDFGSKVLTMDGNNAVLLTSKCEVDDYSLVRTVMRIIVPAKCSVVAMVQVVRKNFKGQMVISPLATCSQFKNDPGITVAPTLVHAKSSRKVPIQIVNDSAITKVVSGKVVIAIAERPSNVVSSAEVMNTGSPSRTMFDNIESPNLDKHQKDELLAVLKRHKHVFAATDEDLGRTDLVEMTVDTQGHRPIKQKPYRSALTQRETIEKHISEMLDAGVVRESASPWASPVVIVPKKDGSLRFCIDYRKLNNITVKNCYPLPNIDDIFTYLGEAKYFSCLDLKSGYWQIAMNEGDKEKTAFVTHQGLYEFNVMPFGLTNAPSVFQELMNHVLKGIRNKYAMAYIDDILIYSRTFEEHVQRISEVFKRLEKANLKLKLKKCEFLKTRVKYLGHVISDKGLEPDPEKVVKIHAMKPPTTVRGVRGFLGAVGYYMKFIENYADIARPLVLLTKKHARFHWDDKCQGAFGVLKEKLTSASILTYPDPNAPYKLYTDASDTTIGAVLAQDTPEGEKVIQYVSHKLNPGQQKWPVIEREAYAITYSINKLRHYLYGAHFTVYCDHKPLQNLFTSEMKNTRVQRWAIQLEEYSPYMEYKPGKKNVVEDLMSRIDTETDDDHYTPVVNVIDSDHLDKTLEQHKQGEDTIREVDISEVQKSIMQSLDILKLQKADSYCQQLFKSIQNETSEQNMQNFVIMDDLVYHVSAPVRLDPEPHLQVVIPSCLTPTILKMYHDESGHLGIDKTYDKIRSRYFWANMYHDVVLHINRCDLCTSRKAKRQRAPLGDMPVPKYPFKNHRY